MDSSDTFQFIILVILLLLSAFFSSAETALMTVNKIRLRSLADDGNRRAALVLDTTSNTVLFIRRLYGKYCNCDPDGCDSGIR